MKQLMVSDRSTLRAGVATLLSQVEAGTVVLEAGEDADALRIALSHANLHSLFVDLHMPMEWLSVMPAFAQHQSAAEINALYTS